MQGQDNKTRQMFSHVSRAMGSVEIADYCSMMGWTADPVVAVLVELLLKAHDEIEAVKSTAQDEISSAKSTADDRVDCRLLAYSNDILERAERSLDLLQDCDFCNASDVLKNLVQDIEEYEDFPGPDDDENSPEAVLKATTIGGNSVKPLPESKGIPGPEPMILLAIKSILGRSHAPMKSVDLVQAVLKENNSDFSEGSIRNEITKAVKKQIVKKAGHGLYCLPNSELS
jgi:hypothetical protein